MAETRSGTDGALASEAPATSDGYRLGRRPGLDGLRGIAVLLVLWNHTALPYSGTAGTVGVVAFFVLSGFLITRLLLEEWDRRSGISLSRFYVRRALRLGPAMVVYLALTAAVAVRYGEPLSQVIWAGLYLTNIVRSLGEFITLTPHTWSLAMEEQFYLVWPLLLLLLLSRLRLDRRALAALLVVAIAASLAYRYSLIAAGADLQRLHNDPLVVAMSLLAGCLLASTIASPRLQILGGTAFVVALAAILGSGIAEKSVATYSVMVPAITLASVVAVAVVARDGRKPAWIEALLTWGPLSYLGRISYGLYLYHYTVYYVVKHEVRGPDTEQILVRLALELGLSLLVAALSYHVVETWFLKKKDDDRWTSVASRSAATPTPS